jgi:sec-independent protein translocase protein TatC
MLIAFGATFQLPVLIFFLSIAGLVNYRQLIKFGRYFIVIAFVLAAVLTPPDITSQVLLAAPLLVLYILSIGISYVVTRKRVQAQDKQAARDAAKD